jgi:hypothetical protein
MSNVLAHHEVFAMRRVQLGMIIAVLSMTVGLVGPVATGAQTASPVAVAGTPGPVTGQAVHYIGSDGAEIGSVTLVSYTEPFEMYDPNSSPDHGFHYVLAQVSIQNTGPRVLQVDPGAFHLIDAQGFVTDPRSINRGDQTDALPDLQSQDLNAGDTISGVIGFEALNGIPLTALVYTPDTDRMINIASLGPAPSPTANTPVSVLGPDGAEIAQATVSDLTDPFNDYDANSAPERGTHFVTLTLNVTNTSPRPLAVDPSRVFLLDTDGFLSGSTTINRGSQPAVPDFTYQDSLAPGAQATGLIGFQVLSGVDLVSVVYRPSNDRLITLATLGS